ncbi:MAG: ATP-binding protein [Rhizomicrobium sp.]
MSDILDISKIESGSFVLNCQPADLGDILDAAAETMRETIAEKSQTLDVRVPRDLPMLVVDSKRIKQVLVNLLSNASKFTSERGRIVLVARANPDGGASVAVADTGVGMSPDQIAIALKPFGHGAGPICRAPRKAPASAFPSPAGWRASTAATSSSKASPARAPPSSSPCRGAPRHEPGLPSAAAARRRAAKERRGVPAMPPVQIAHVVSVAGSHCIAVLEHRTKSAVAAKDPRVQIGALVKIVTPASAVMGLVSAMTAPMPNARRPRGNRPDRDTISRRSGDRREFQAPDLQARRDAASLDRRSRPVRRPPRPDPRLRPAGDGERQGRDPVPGPERGRRGF